jgi:hypothetical protein
MERFSGNEQCHREQSETDLYQTGVVNGWPAIRLQQFFIDPAALGISRD